MAPERPLELQAHCLFPKNAAPLAYQVAAALGELELEVAVVKSVEHPGSIEVIAW